MEYERIHFLLSMSSDSALYAVENSLTVGGFRVVNRLERPPGSLYGGKCATKANYDLTVIDSQSPADGVGLTDSTTGLPKIALRTRRGSYTEVFLVPSSGEHGAVSSELPFYISESVAIRLARAILEAGRYAFRPPVLNSNEDKSVDHERNRL